MWRRYSIRRRVLIIAAALSVLTIGGGMFSLWYSFQTKAFFKEVLDEQIAALKAADRLEIALVMQKGYITYFFQDRNPIWLEELDRQHQEFTKLLDEARLSAEMPEDHEILNQIVRRYQEFCQLRNQVIERYKAGERQAGFDIHKAARQEFFEILDLTGEYYHIHENHMNQARADIQTGAGHMSALALGALPITVFLSIFLMITLIRNILGPIRRLAHETALVKEPGLQGNDVQILTHEVHDLMEDFQQTKSKLGMREDQLLQAAKLASVGRLAASVAHSIRNPLASVKMRLFSLQRNQALSETQLEDCRVISEEVRNIDTVLRNFLEFSRRPKLELTTISPSEIVDMAVDLVRPRLESSKIELQLVRAGWLPEIQADPAQLKEAIVNLLVNASESMEESGRIVIQEEHADAPPQGPTLIIRFNDNGPGIPEAIQNQIFHPFFTTKGEGTGLGLSITKRILEEHGGSIAFESSSAQGTSFAIMLPVKEE